MYWLTVIIYQMETSLSFKQQVKNGSVLSFSLSITCSNQKQNKQIRKKTPQPLFAIFSCKIWFLPLTLFHFHFKHVLTKLFSSKIVSIQFKVKGFFFLSFNNLHIKALLNTLWNDCVQKNNNFSLIVLLSCRPQSFPIASGLPNNIPSCRNLVTANGCVSSRPYQ